jgi:hypothetical protein
MWLMIAVLPPLALFLLLALSLVSRGQRAR